MTLFVLGSLAGAGVIGVFALSTVLVRSLNNRAGTQIRMLARQYRAMMDSAGRDVPMDLVAQPHLISSRMEFRKIEAIEAELVNSADQDVAHKLLADICKMEDPWVRARAAKVLYQLDAKKALAELKSLIDNPEPYIELPAIWALGELSTPSALHLLTSLVWSKNSEVQQAVIRSLIQIDLKNRLPTEEQIRVKKLLQELRFKTEWIL
jgi:HEAT repeat protein